MGSKKHSWNKKKLYYCYWFFSVFVVKLLVLNLLCFDNESGMHNEFIVLNHTYSFNNKRLEISFIKKKNNEYVIYVKKINTNTVYSTYY